MRKEDVLDAPYFHLVFTVPAELNPVIYSNQKLLYDTLYHAASATINDLSVQDKYLGANVGYICILHTWGSEMNYHPHIHTILLGGGLDASDLFIIGRGQQRIQNRYCGHTICPCKGQNTIAEFISHSDMVEILGNEFHCLAALFHPIIRIMKTLRVNFQGS